jgi:hypothetical protein
MLELDWIEQASCLCLPALHEAGAPQDERLHAQAASRALHIQEWAWAARPPLTSAER